MTAKERNFLKNPQEIEDEEIMLDLVFVCIFKKEPTTMDAALSQFVSFGGWKKRGLCGRAKVLEGLCDQGLVCKGLETWQPK